MRNSIRPTLFKVRIQIALIYTLVIYLAACFLNKDYKFHAQYGKLPLQAMCDT